MYDFEKAYINQNDSTRNSQRLEDQLHKKKG
jgi:hypothetical protein